jgi:integrase
MKKLDKQFPKGTRFGDWYIAKDATLKAGFGIRRRVYLPEDGYKQERLDAKIYSNITDAHELEDLLDRLNHRTKRRKLELESMEAIRTRLAFLPQERLEKFRLEFVARYTHQREQNYYYKTCFQKYFLNFFVSQLGLYDPAEWHKNQFKWGHALTQFVLDNDRTGRAFDKDERKALAIFTTEADEEPSLRRWKTIKEIVLRANIFMSWLHKEMPGEMPLYLFQPLTLAQIHKYEAAVKTTEDGEKASKFVNEKDWKVIEEELPDDMKPFVLMAYYYGLRRSETLALMQDDVLSDHLLIRRQLLSINHGNFVYGSPKDKEERKVPHWFCDAKKAMKLVDQSMDYIVAPDSLTTAWALFMKKINMPYHMHDLRHTFMTRALREHDLIDVQHAAGHSNPTTTLGYQQDDRTLKHISVISSEPGKKPSRKKKAS